MRIIRLILATFILVGCAEKIATVKQTSDDADLPTRYSTDDLFEQIRRASLSLPEHFARLCCDPEIDLAEPSESGVWYFDDLLGALRDLRAEFIEKATAGQIAETEVSQRISDALEFCYRRRQLILIEGASGLGKSETAKAWCRRFPGLVRYVEVPSSNDDRSFYVAIADALGVAQGESYNTQQIKLRVEKTLRLSRIMLLLDEAQYLWPQVVTPRGIPARMLWVKTMYDAGTPIALLGLPDFTAWKNKYVRKTLWNGDQLDGRLNYPLTLPLSHSLNDLKAIARIKHPHGDSASWKILAGLALSLSRTKPHDRTKPNRVPAKNARTIAAVIERASFAAEKSGRQRVTTADVKAAIRVEFPNFDFGNPSAPDTAIADPSQLARSECVCSALATGSKDRCTAGAYGSANRAREVFDSRCERLKPQCATCRFSRRRRDKVVHAAARVNCTLGNCRFVPDNYPARLQAQIAAEESRL